MDSGDSSEHGGDTMSTVGPSDGGYNYYQKNITELEDDLKNESNRARKHEKERIESLEEAYNRDIRDHDEKTAETLKNYKANAQDENERDRAYSNAEIKRIKNETYDKFGRYNGQEADVIKAELENTKNAASRQYEKDQKHLRDTEAGYSARLAAYNDDYNDRLTTAVANARDSATNAYENSAASARAASDSERDQNRQKLDSNNQHHIDDMNELRRRYESATGSMKRDYDHQIDRLSKTDDSRFVEAQRALQHKAELSTRALNDSHAEETAKIRSQEKMLEESSGDYAHGRAQGTQDAVREYEDDWRNRVKLEQEAYENQIDDLQRKSGTQERKMTDKYATTLQDKDKYYAGVIQRQNQENHGEKTRMVKTFSADRQAMEIRQQKDRELAQRALESRLGESAANNALALDKQALAYQDTLSRENQDHRTETALLEKELQYRRTSDDTNSISPAAEEKLRKSVSGEYEKVMTTETKKNRATQDSIQKSYADRLHDSIMEHETKERGMSMEAANQQHQAETQFLDHVNDVEESKQSTLRSKDLDNDRITENLMRNYSTMLNRQKAEHDDILQTQRAEASGRLVSAKQEAAFNSRMSQRAFANQQNELIREYDRKLAAQKADHDAQIDNLKTTHQNTLRDQERRNKQQLEEMQRSYDQRLAQTEAQHAERERYLTQNYQDELEKVRSANAKLIQKKS